MDLLIIYKSYFLIKEELLISDFFQIFSFNFRILNLSKIKLSDYQQPNLKHKSTLTLHKCYLILSFSYFIEAINQLNINHFFLKIINILINIVLLCFFKKFFS